jgi:phosphoesterase RecJ-like protein
MPGNSNAIEFIGNEDKCKSITENADLIFMLDFNVLERADKYGEVLKKSNAKKVLIDHHQDPDHSIADLIFSDTSSSSTCQLLFEILDTMGYCDSLNKDIATCLYVGIMTDTGSFKYNSTTSKTHEVVSKLISNNIVNAIIHDSVYYN